MGRCPTSHRIVLFFFCQIIQGAYLYIYSAQRRPRRSNGNMAGFHPTWQVMRGHVMIFLAQLYQQLYKLL